MSQFLNDQAADGVGFFAAVFRAEKGVDVFDFGCGVDASDKFIVNLTDKVIEFASNMKPTTV